MDAGGKTWWRRCLLCHRETWAEAMGHGRLVFCSIFRPKNEENVMNTWQNLMTFKQSQNNEDKMLTNDFKKSAKT